MESLVYWSCGGQSFQPARLFRPRALTAPPVPSARAHTEACELNPGVIGIASGGNDDLVPGWFVAYDPTLDAIVVAHQGTNTSSL